MVSIIVPVYNAEEYLGKCIDSIVNQTYQDIEIILIDDGSRDNSLSICKQWVEKDKRICVIHQENKGVSSARNIGLKHVHGEYIIFVDSDDEVKSWYIEKLMTAIFNDKTDLVVGQELHCYGDGSADRLTKVYGKITNNFWVDFYALWELLTTPHGKLYRAKIIFEYDIHFPEYMRRHEDQYFNAKYFWYVDKYSYVSTAGYIWWHRDNDSLSHNVVTCDDAQGMLSVYELHEKLLSEKNVENWQKVLNTEIFSVVMAIISCSGMKYSQRCLSLDLCRKAMMPCGAFLTCKGILALNFVRIGLYFPLVVWCAFRRWQRRK